MTERELADVIARGDLDRVKKEVAASPELATSIPPNAPSMILWALYCGQSAAAVEIADAITANGTEIGGFEAAALNRVDALRRALSNSPSVAYDVSQDGFTALGYAAFFGAEDATDLLLEAGADPNRISENEIGVAPIHSAMASGNRAIANRILDCGGNASIASKSGWTPLHYAAHLGDLSLTKRLLALKTDRAATTHDGLTSADLARSQGNWEVADLIECQTEASAQGNGTPAKPIA